MIKPAASCVSPYLSVPFCISLFRSASVPCLHAASLSLSLSHSHSLSLCLSLLQHARADLSLSLRLSDSLSASLSLSVCLFLYVYSACLSACPCLAIMGVMPVTLVTSVTVCVVSACVRTCAHDVCCLCVCV